MLKYEITFTLNGYEMTRAVYEATDPKHAIDKFKIDFSDSDPEIRQVAQIIPRNAWFQ